MDKNESESEFMKIHLLVVAEMKKSLGILCKDVRLRNGLSQEYVSERTGISDKSITHIERRYNTSLDLINTLYFFYYKEGYITKEEQKCNSIDNFFNLL